MSLRGGDKIYYHYYSQFPSFGSGVVCLLHSPTRGFYWPPGRKCNRCLQGWVDRGVFRLLQEETPYGGGDSLGGTTVGSVSGGSVYVGSIGGAVPENGTPGVQW